MFENMFMLFIINKLYGSKSYNLFSACSFCLYYCNCLSSLFKRFFFVTSLKSSGVKLVLWAQSYPLVLVKWCGYVSKMPALTYNRVNSVIIKKVIILNIINNFFLFKKTNHFSMRGFLFRTVPHNKTVENKI